MKYRKLLGIITACIIATTSVAMPVFATDSVSKNETKQAEEEKEKESETVSESGSEKDKEESSEAVSEDKATEKENNPLIKPIPGLEEPAEPVQTASGLDAPKAEVSENEVTEEEPALKERTIEAEADGHKITATGLMPEDAVLSVKKHSTVESSALEGELNKDNEGVNITVYDAFDIEILSKGEEWQPVEHDTEVKIRIEETSAVMDKMDADKEAADKQEDYMNFSVGVTRIDEETGEKKELEATTDEAGIEFTTEHFTTFIINGTSYDTSGATESIVISADSSVIAYWFKDQSKLIIHGDGATEDYAPSLVFVETASPLANFNESGPYTTNSPVEVIIDSGVTRLGNNLFYGADLITKANFVGSPELGNGVFCGAEPLCVQSDSPVEYDFDGDGRIPYQPDGDYDISSDSDGSVMAYFYTEDHPLIIAGNGTKTKSYTPSPSDSIPHGGQRTASGSKNPSYPSVQVYNEEALGPLSNMSPISENLRHKAFSVEWRTPNLDNIGDSLFFLCKDMTMPEGIPNTVVNIGKDAFYDCEALSGDVIPSNPMGIGKGAFYNCKNITDTSLGTRLGYIAPYAFSGCEKMALTALPDTVTLIQEGAFTSCDALALDALPGGVTSVEDSAFYGCPELTISEFPSGLTSIGPYAFSGDKKITVSKLPNSLTSIDIYGLSDCQGITEISGGTGLTHVGITAFWVGTPYNATNPLETELTAKNTLLKNYDWAMSNRELAVHDVYTLSLPMSIELKSVDETDYNLRGVLKYMYDAEAGHGTHKDVRIDISATEDMKSDDGSTLGFTFVRAVPASGYQDPNETFADDGKSAVVNIGKNTAERIHSIYVVSTRNDNKAYNNGKITVSVTQP